MRTKTLLGTCGNARWDSWKGIHPVNYRGCNQPAMALFDDHYNLCVACGVRTAGFRDRLLHNTVEDFDLRGATKWLAGSHDRYVDAAAFSYLMGSQPKKYKLEQVHKQQSHADGTAEIINAMLDRWGDEIRYAIAMRQLDPDDFELRVEDLEPIR